MKNFVDGHYSDYYDTLPPHCPDPESMTRDKRTIMSVTWGPTTWAVGDLIHTRGHKSAISKIVVYKETGRPWVAFYVEDEIIMRADYTGAIISYAIQGEE